MIHTVEHQGEMMENSWCCIVQCRPLPGPTGATETITTHIRLDQASFIVPQGHIHLVAVTKY